MNKSHPHSHNVANYLTNTSLFKSNQKNRFVSAYRNHQEPSPQQMQTVRNGLAYNSLGGVRKEERFESLGGQLQPVESKPDALKATVKKDPSLQYPPESVLQQESALLKGEEGSQKQREEPLRQSSSKAAAKSILGSEDSAGRSGTKIVVNYSKNSSAKMRERENIIEIIEQSQPRNKNSRHSSYLKIKQGLEVEEATPDNLEQEINPYLPSSAKRQSEHHDDGGEVRFKKIESKSFIPSDAPREELFLTHSSISRRREQPSEQEQILRREDHLTSVRREVGGYLTTVRERLTSSYASLETMQSQFQAYVEKTVELQCERVKGGLMRTVEEGVRDLREFQRRQLSKQKLLFMADLFQIKCNIDLRLGEIQEYSSQLRSQHWKAAIGSIVALDYNQNIEFVLGKSQEIQQDLLANTAPALKDYLAVLNQQVTQHIRTAISDSFQESLQKFGNLRIQGRIFTRGQQQPPFPSATAPTNAPH